MAVRAESGPMQFGDDWPGVFIRGDHALWLATKLEEIAHRLPADDEKDVASLLFLAALVGDLRDCDVRTEHTQDVQQATLLGEGGVRAA